MKLIKESILFLSVLSGLFWASADAKFGEHLAVVTKLEGKVKIFTHPSNTLPRTLQSNGKGTHVLYDGEYYLAEDAKIGDHVENGNILQTLPGAKAKLVYPNGDQFYVGPATSYRVFFMDKSGHGDTRINLMYGKMRGIVEKGGPRTILYIRTKTAIMGVRGTDFFIAQGGLEESTEVSILRGSVEVTPNNIPEARGKFFKISDSSPSMGDLKSTQVKAGFSADIGTPSVLALSNLPAVDLRKTTQEEFSGIQKTSTISQAPAIKSELPLKEGMQKKIELLEQKAVNVTLGDIQKYDNLLFKQMQTLNIKSADDLNNAAMQNLIKEAPKAPPKSTRKPFKSELDDIQSGAYEKYFKDIK